MNKKNLCIIALATAALTLSSCASKKELESCRLENKELTTNFQDAKEQLAASRTRVTSLEEQLAAQRKAL